MCPNVQCGGREYEQDMEELRDLVGRRSAVPKERVYPLFEALARRWTEAVPPHPPSFHPAPSLLPWVGSAAAVCGGLTAAGGWRG
jgi:hypothetical protein